MKSIVDGMVVEGKTVRNALVAVFALVVGAAMPAFAADWTDANNATYTALKSINGGGSGYIATATWTGAAGNGDFSDSGNLSLVKDGPGTFLWRHDAESALSATIPVLVTNGVFKIGATTGNLFGASGTVTVKALGQFDINTTQKYGPVRARTFYIEGDGPDGSGAIVNSAANTQWGYQLNKIRLDGRCDDWRQGLHRTP